MNEPTTHCALCGDEAVPAVVRAVFAADSTADVELGGECAVQRVALDLVDDVRVGDTLLVHQGFAISVLRAS